jgi:hypothetical protein
MRERWDAFWQRAYVERLWVWWAAIFSFQSAVLSWPSDGTAKFIIPIFAAAGGLLTAAALKKSVGLALFGFTALATASFSRSAALAGLDQDGAGSDWIAAATWLAIGLAVLLLAVDAAQRGLE